MEHDFQIERLSDFIDSPNYQDLAHQIYFVTDHLKQDYPKHREWFFEKHLPGVGKDREVLFVRVYNNVYGVAFLKNTTDEKKICTFYIAEHGRNMGVGRAMMRETLNYLQTNTPIITMPGHKVRFFLDFVHIHNWKIQQILKDFYVRNQDEIVFNGELR
jgi:ribosomal protein S18 acetylase RimI-like enzyme